MEAVESIAVEDEIDDYKQVLVPIEDPPKFINFIKNN